MSLRTGGREAVEDTPVTGATAEQIRNAKELIYVNVPINQELAVRKSVDVVARYLVPVGYVIVRAEDALTAEDRAAIGRFVAVAQMVADGMGISESVLDEFNASRDQISAIAAGGQA